ncbi:MAG: divalent-cation tolerance protein CutA [Acetobacterales bacterium]
MDHCLVYITAASREEAHMLAKILVEERLAACANVLGDIRSFFRWEGEARDDGEVSLIAKTRTAVLERLTARVVEMHSYDCPCVVALPIVGGHAPFLSWIEDETR